jgi:predicted amidohydrolase YtcJ
MEDIIFVNGTILTMNPAQPKVDAVAIRGDKILVAGTEAELREVAHKAEVIDLQGRTLLPGFHDSHVHLLYHGLELTQLHLEEAKTLDEALVIIAQRAHQTPKGEWIHGAGFLMARWGVNALDKSRLDEIAPHHPVFLRSQDHHSAWANSLALKLAGVTSSTPNPESGEIVKDNSGQPTGLLLELAQHLVQAVVPKPSSHDLSQALYRAADHLASLGITTVHNMAAEPASYWRATASVASQAYALRVWTCIDQEHIEHAAAVGLATGQGGDSFQVGGAKFFADGALGSMTALMLGPYAGSDSTGIEVHSRHLLQTRIPLAIQAGLVPVIHCIGDKANRVVLDVLEETQHLWQPLNMRPRIEHAQHLHPSDLPRFAKLGVIASMQPIHYRFDAKRIAELLPDRLAGAHAWRSLLNAGSVIPLGSDTPVATPDVILGLQTACQRSAESNAFGFDQVFSIDEALAGYTRQAAYAIAWEHRSGRIKTGFDADLVMLSHDPYQSLEQVSVEATMKAGQWTFNNKG